MAIDKAVRCCSIVVQYEGLARYEHRCTRRGTLAADGKMYCGVHSPAAVAKRRAKSQERYEQQRKEWEAEREAERRAAALVELCQGLDIAQLVNAIRDEARCTPHTPDWFNARDAVGRAAMELAESVRKENTR